MAEHRPTRRQFTQLTLAAAALAGCRKAPAAMNEPIDSTTSSLLPTLFVGHGSPMNALLDNQWSRGMAQLGRQLPSVKAILCISAHWETNGPSVTLSEPPRTIHDFGGFPPALHQMQYPAPGNASLARHIAQLLKLPPTAGSSGWGLDHGTWSVLCHTHPNAEVPVIQLSLDKRRSPAEHLQLARALAPLRQQGVLIVGSGNIVHNLGHALRQGAQSPANIAPFARQFDDAVALALQQQDFSQLARLPETDLGRVAHPSLEHYLPLLYTVGAALGSDAELASPATYPLEGFDMGSISMRSVLLS